MRYGRYTALLEATVTVSRWYAISVGSREHLLHDCSMEVIQLPQLAWIMLLRLGDTLVNLHEFVYYSGECIPGSECQGTHMLKLYSFELYCLQLASSHQRRPTRRGKGKST